MTVLYPERFKEAAAAGFDGTFEWDFLIEAFKPTKIQPMDLDCLVERRRRFLAFETKDGDVAMKTAYYRENDGECDCYRVSNGQRIYYGYGDNELVHELSEGEW